MGTAGRGIQHLRRCGAGANVPARLKRCSSALPPCLRSQEKALLDGIKELAKKKEALQIRLEQAQNRMDLAM